MNDLIALLLSGLPFDLAGFGLGDLLDFCRIFDFPPSREPTGL